jgi:hypothetical protein
MTINTTAKSRVFVGAANATISALEDFEAVSWTEILEVEDLGEWGVEGSVQTFLSMADGYVRKLKGSLDSGSVELVVARDPSDEGQNLLRSAAGDWFKYPIKVELNDKPTTTGANTVYYFRAIIGSAKSNYGNADNITRTTFTLAIDGAILEVAAAPVVTFSPAAGALDAATESTAYTATVTASGGIGTVSYAVTTGTLPDGLTLNAATGEISGTPTATGTSNFTITAIFSGAGEEDAAYSIVVSA